MKAMYLSISFVIPLFAARIVFRQALLALLIMYVAVGLASAAIFQLEHSVDGTNYRPPELSCSPSSKHFGRFACEYHRPETLWGN